MITKRNIIIMLLFLLAIGSFYISSGDAQDPPAAPTQSTPATPAAPAAPSVSSAPSGPGAPTAPVEASGPSVTTPAAAPSVQPAPVAPAVPATPPPPPTVTLSVEKTSVNNGGQINVKGRGIPGKPVYIEVWSENKVKSSFFDSKPGKDGKSPYKLYLTYAMPASYKIYLPESQKSVVDSFKKKGKKWNFAEALKALDAEVAYSTPANIQIDVYQSTLMASVIGSRGAKLPALDAKENRKHSMQLVKSRFEKAGRLFVPSLDVKPDGSFSGVISIPEGGSPGKYEVVAVSGASVRSQPATVENHINFPMIYLSNAGTSLNALWPFVLTLAISIFGVLMGAGGGFILNPLLVSIWPLPHTIVAGTVMPTVLFSQASGIYNYSKIKFISWKLGITMGLAMLAGGFIGPKLTEMITLSQFKFVFGWILLVLAGLMFWQTTPGYVSKNKKEQAIMAEFKKRAEAAAKAK